MYMYILYVYIMYTCDGMVVFFYVWPVTMDGPSVVYAGPIILKCVLFFLICLL